MPLQPMDIQVLFLRLDTIGRESTAQQQAAAQGQDVAGKELAKQSQDRARQVSRAESLPDGAERVKDDNSEEEQERAADYGSSGERDNAPSSSTDDTFRDPDIGRTIDLSG